MIQSCWILRINLFTFCMSLAQQWQRTNSLPSIRAPLAHLMSKLDHLYVNTLDWMTTAKSKQNKQEMVGFFCKQKPEYVHFKLVLAIRNMSGWDQGLRLPIYASQSQATSAGISDETYSEHAVRGKCSSGQYFWLLLNCFFMSRVIGLRLKISRPRGIRCGPRHVWSLKPASELEVFHAVRLHTLPWILFYPNFLPGSGDGSGKAHLIACTQLLWWRWNT